MNKRWKRKLPQCLFPMEQFPEPSYSLKYHIFCRFVVFISARTRPINRFPFHDCQAFSPISWANPLFLLIIFGISRDVSQIMCFFLGSFIVSIFIIGSLYCSPETFNASTSSVVVVNVVFLFNDPILAHHFIYMDKYFVSMWCSGN